MRLLPLHETIRAMDVIRKVSFHASPFAFAFVPSNDRNYLKGCLLALTLALALALCFVNISSFL